MQERISLLTQHSATADQHVDNTNLNGSVASVSTHEVSLQMSEVDELLSMLERAQTVLKNQAQEIVEKKTFLPFWLIRYLLVISIVWQVLCIGVLSIVDAKTVNTTSHHSATIASNVTLTVFTAVHLVVVMLITVRVARKVAAHTATFSFLIQSYLSTVLLFSGLYTLSTRFECHSFRHIDEKGVNYCSASSEKLLITLFIRLLYFSVSSSTLCGITDIQPNKWYTELTVASQMLLSFLYFASILTQTYHKQQSKISIWDTSTLLRKLKKMFIKVGS